MAALQKTMFSRLAKTDTPTVCNALELVLGERRAHGFTRKTMILAPQQSAVFIGRAKTATLRAIERPGACDAERRMKYFRYIAEKGAVAVIEDLDRPAGLGAFWGEVHSAVHSAMGLAGVVTTGAVRDLDALSPKLPILAGAVTPSHAFVDIEQLDATVNIFGMTVSPGDIIHADRHGAIVIPEDALSHLPKAIATVAKREKEILAAAKSPNFSLHTLERALRRSRDIH